MNSKFLWMESNFFKWYSQALGSTIGIIACLYAYIIGHMAAYGTIGSYYDYLWFGGIIGSYLLFPLCIISLILSITKCYLLYRDILTNSFNKLNDIIIILTCIIGILGAQIYFIPSILLMACESTYRFIKQREEANDTNQNVISVLKESENKNYMARLEIATDFLDKEASFDFISEVSGFSFDELKLIKKQIEKSEC